MKEPTQKILGWLKKKCSIRKWFIKNGFRFQEETVLCKRQYILQIMLMCVITALSWYFIVIETSVYHVFILNLLNYIMNVVVHLTKHKKVKSKLSSTLDKEIYKLKEKGKEFYKKIVREELGIMLILLVFFVIVVKYCLPAETKLIPSNVLKVFCICFLLICGFGNIESILEEMYTAEMDFIKLIEK
ncbi:MAG: hypothetical protein NC293_11685 [Roseburia sp.]|nr:hypothetical protein [Roseburia sp.]